MDGLGQERRRRRGRQVEDRGQLVGQAAGGPVGVEGGDVGRALAGEDHDPAVDHRADGLELELQRGDDAEVAAATAQPPEELGVAVGAGAHEAAVGGHDVGAHEVVAGQALLAHEPADAAAQGEARDAGGRDEAAGGREPEGLRLGVEVLPQQAGLGDDAAGAGIDAGALHHREVDDDALGGREAGDRVRAAADGDLEALAAGELDGAHDVGGARAAHDERGVDVVEHRVPDLAGVVVALVAGSEHGAPDGLAQLGDLAAGQRGNGGHGVS